MSNSSVEFYDIGPDATVAFELVAGAYTLTTWDSGIAYHPQPQNVSPCGCIILQVQKGTTTNWQDVARVAVPPLAQNISMGPLPDGSYRFVLQSLPRPINISLG